MHVAIYHDALIPPQKYGGTERIVFWLAKALVSLGHRVSLIAKPGSSVPGVEFISYTGQSEKSWEQLVPSSADLIHLWATPPILPKKPFLVTIEGNGQLGEKFHSNTVFVSRKHAENHGSRYFVHNGIDPADFDSTSIRENYVVFLAKANWKVKNLKGAIQIARNTGIELRVMGSRLPSFLKWRGVRYLGMVGDREKREVLKKARALLFPVRWHEPFGIAITEALASGCPVFGTPYGSLPEIVTSEVGTLSTDSQELQSALISRTISPEKCRERVLSGLTHIDMAKKYLTYYREILENEKLNQNENELGLRLLKPADHLLPWDE